MRRAGRLVLLLALCAPAWAQTAYTVRDVFEAGPTVYALTVAPIGDVWVGTNRGVARIGRQSARMHTCKGRIG